MRSTASSTPSRRRSSARRPRSRKRSYRYWRRAGSTISSSTNTTRPRGNSCSPWPTRCMRLNAIARVTTPNLFLMTWKVPALGEFRLDITPRLPTSCHVVGELTSMQAGGAFIEHGRVGCDLDLAGQMIAVNGLDATMTDVLVRIQTADGAVRTARLTPSSPSFTVPAHAGPLMVLSAYIGLGIEHILFG